MYILVNNHRSLLGLFTDKTWLNAAIKTVRNEHPDSVLYYQTVTPNEFSSILFNFWTMHPEKLIEISKETEMIND